MFPGESYEETLRDYTDIPLFSGLEPSDIEDVTTRYHAFLGIQFDNDTVKRIRVQAGGQEQEVFIVSIIEHKSYVDYDVAMQLMNRIECGDFMKEYVPDFQYKVIRPFDYTNEKLEEKMMKCP